jgi:hypothetical protein
MQNLEGKTIIYLSDVATPPAQAGKMGESKVVTREGNFAANFLLRGQRIRVIQPSEAHAVRVELGLEKPKPERRANVRRQGTHSQRDQGSDPGKEETPAAGGTG